MIFEYAVLSIALPQISIIIPAYNEEENLPELIPVVNQVIKNSRLTAEYIIIDDFSTDNTFKVGKQLEKQFPLKIIKGVQ